MTNMTKESATLARLAGADLVIQEPIFKRTVFNILVKAGIVDEQSSSNEWLQKQIYQNSYFNYTLFN